MTSKTIVVSKQHIYYYQVKHINFKFITDHLNITKMKYNFLFKNLKIGIRFQNHFHNIQINDV